MPETSSVSTEQHSIETGPFRGTLIAWGEEHFRSFPWRLAEDPYCILMAEVMLHRTQARQVLPVYSRFVERYPDTGSLARASVEDLYRELSSLGLRWRIALIHDLAAEIRDRFNGRIPTEKDALLSLPGVSDYIASSVRCFAWNFPEPLIDTNTVRVVGRLFGLEIRDSSRRNPRFKKLIAALVDPKYPRDYNYALLDLAHLVCHRRRPPECELCPVRASCVYGSGRVLHEK